MKLPVIPLSLFAVTLGLAGLGGAWTAADGLEVAPHWPEEVLFGASATLWLVFTLLYAARGLTERGTFRTDLRHPISGPFAANIPVVGILLNVHYGFLYPALSTWVCVALVAALAVLDAQLISHWLAGDLPKDSLHMGYFLPVVAGSFIGSIGLSAANLHEASVAAFGVGLFFFVVLGGVIIGRLISGAQPPLQLRPSLAILLAAPATGGVALFIDNKALVTDLQLAFAGVAVVMFLVQMLLIPYFKEVPFSLGYWTFTFPVAAATNYTIRWVGVGQFAGSSIVIWLLLAVATVFILTIAAASVRVVIRNRSLSRSDHAQATSS